MLKPVPVLTFLCLAGLALAYPQATVPGTPLLISPANGAFTNNTQPTLSWNAAANATSYDVYFGSSPAVVLVANVTSTSFSPGTLIPGAQYYWQIIARNDFGSTPSAEWSFTLLYSSTIPANLSISKSHHGNFAQGQNGALFTIVVSNNVLSGATAGAVTVTDTLPTGLTLLSMSGIGWSCSGATCTRSDVLPPGVSFTPITVAVNVDPTAPVSLTNQASVSGGGANTVSTSDTVTITGTVTIYSPSVTSLSPVVSSGPSQTFTLQFSDTAGAADFTVLNMLVNTALDGRHACYIAYDRPSNTVFLVNDAGDGHYAGTVVLNGSGSVSNSQCTVSAAGSSAIVNGTTLTLALNIAFNASFVGNRVVYLAAQDSQQNTGWQTMGAYLAPITPKTFPNSLSMTPSSGSSSNATLSFTYEDATSAANLQTTWALINTAVDGRSACYVAYYRPGNLLFLVPDSGDGNQATSMFLGGNNTLSNSQCTVSSQGSSLGVNGGQLTVTLNIAFKPAFAGPKGVWMAAQTLAGQTSAWQVAGAWQVPPGS